MAFFYTKPEKIKNIVLFSTGAFAAAAVMYFSGTGPAFRIAFPLAILTLASLWLTPWEMTLALLFSAIGDYFGSESNFIVQMACFAAAHIWFITFFIRRYATKVEHDGKLTLKAKGYAAMLVFMGCVLTVWVFCTIVPAAPSGFVRTGVAIYAVLICVMLILALLQRSSLYAVGAMLFVFSDFILAWNRFKEPIPAAGYLIMIPYYIGQWLIFVRATPYRVPGLRRHRM